MSSAELFEKNNSVTKHQRNLQVPATEIFKVKNWLAAEIMKEVSKIQNPAYNFRSEATHFKSENVKTTHYGIQSVGFFWSKMWDMVPKNIKNCSSLNKLKNSIKLWPNEFPCRICQKYIAQVGFIWFTSPFCNKSEEKKLYILYFLRFFIYILYITQKGMSHLVFRWGILALLLLLLFYYYYFYYYYYYYHYCCCYYYYNWLELIRQLL